MSRNPKTKAILQKALSLLRSAEQTEEDYGDAGIFIEHAIDGVEWALEDLNLLDQLADDDDGPVAHGRVADAPPARLKAANDPDRER
jgi:hypothetical protein